VAVCVQRNRKPLRGQSCGAVFLLSAWPWRSAGYLLSTSLVIMTGLPAVLLLMPWLALIAEGHSNSAIARQLVITEAAVGKHVGNIFAKLHLPVTDDTNRRVLAVLTYLRATKGPVRPMAGPAGSGVTL
jgi:Bacterial regulatory proteins, luxR family